MNSKSIIKPIEYIIKTETFLKPKKLKFIKYISLSCKTYLANGINLNFCYDFEFEPFLISTKMIRKHFSKMKIFKMNNENEFDVKK